MLLNQLSLVNFYQYRLSWTNHLCWLSIKNTVSSFMNSLDVFWKRASWPWNSACKTTYYFETLSSTNSPTTTTPNALTPPSTKDDVSLETDSVEPSSSPRVEHMRSRLCASVEFDLSNSSDNSAFSVYSIPLKDWGDADSSFQSISLPRDLIEVSRTSLSATSGRRFSDKRSSSMMNPVVIPSDILKLQARGTMETTT